MKLTGKEKEIMFYVSEGYSNKEIAKEVYLAEVTVKKHLANIYEKYGLTNERQNGTSSLRVKAVLIYLGLKRFENEI